MHIFFSNVKKNRAPFSLPDDVIDMFMGFIDI